MDTPSRKFRLKLNCKNLTDYSQRFAPQFNKEFFAPSAKPSPPQTKVTVEIVFADGNVGITGKAVVVRSEQRKGREGLVLRFIDQNSRTTAALVAQTDKETVSDFDTDNPTRPSELSTEIAQAIKRKPEEEDLEPEISIEDNAPPQAPAANTAKSEEAPLPVATSPNQAPTPVPEAPAVLEAQAVVQATTSLFPIWMVGAVALTASTAVLFFALQSKSNATPERPTETAAQIAAKEKQSKIQESISAADKHAAAGRLTGPNSALDVLLEASKLAPKHAGVTERLHSLADKFQELAEGASGAGNYAEAATHLQAALLADPKRTELTSQMTQLENKIRNEQSE